MMIKRFKWTCAALIAGAVLYLLALFTDAELFEHVIEFFEELEHWELDEIFILAFLFATGLVVDLILIKKQKEHQQAIQEKRLEIFQTTMGEVHDVVNNLLNNLEYFRTEIEERNALEAHEREAFEKVIDNAADNIRNINRLEEVIKNGK